MRTWAILLLLLLGGCAQPARVDPAAIVPLLHDAAFAPSAEPVGAADLFTLSEAMRAHVRSAAFTARLRERGAANGLVEALYAKGDLKLDYDATVTRTAAQTYAARAGNCLSLVVMTAAFARELGMTVRFQRVEVEDSWSRNGDLYLASTHVNLSLGQGPRDLDRGADPERLLTIDFLPPQDLRGYRTHVLEEADIIAMYLNNRAAEALVQNRLDEAYWWARAAALQPSPGALALNTLGVIYQRHGDPQRAEQALRAALQREPANLVAMRNLLPVLAATGKTDEAVALTARLAQLEPAPPFHYYAQGLRALDAGDPARARSLFAREVARAPDNDEFHFWLAVALLRLGDAAQARQELALALSTSGRRERRELYAAKLAHLHRQEAGRQ